MKEGKCFSLPSAAFSRQADVYLKTPPVEIVVTLWIAETPTLDNARVGKGEREKRRGDKEVIEKEEKGEIKGLMQ